jgi:hypothetical protein
MISALKNEIVSDLRMIDDHVSLIKIKNKEVLFRVLSGEFILMLTGWCFDYVSTRQSAGDSFEKMIDMSLIECFRGSAGQSLEMIRSFIERDQINDGCKLSSMFNDTNKNLSRLIGQEIILLNEQEGFLPVTIKELDLQIRIVMSLRNMEVAIMKLYRFARDLDD